MNTVQRVRAILKVNRSSTPSVLTTAHAVNNGMAADPARFPAPLPSLAILDAQITAVDETEQRTATRARGAAAARNVQRGILVGMLETERSYVQTLCDASPAEAAAIIEAAGMEVAIAPARNDPLLKATGGMQSGTVALHASAALLLGRRRRSALYNWQWTTDGGKVFHDAPSTPHAKTMIANLTPLTMVGFRVSITDINGPREWSQGVTVLIH
jgi:hypothetical protein